MDLTLQLMDMQQCFVQAVPPAVELRPAAELMQLPHMTLPLALAVTRKAKLGELGLQGFWKMEDAQRRKLLGVGKEGKDALSAKQYDELMRVVGEWPRIELVDSFFKGALLLRAEALHLLICAFAVNGERLVTTGAIVQFVIKARTLPFRRDGVMLNSGARPGTEASRRDEESSVRPSTEDDEEVSLDHLIGRTDTKTSKEGKQPVGVAHAPHFIEVRCSRIAWPARLVG
jgi:translocation protein SEC63